MTLHILQAGPLLTIQDHGRHYWRRWGVPASGALDPVAHQIANRLVGNPGTAATLELQAGSCRLQSTLTTVAALTGADVTPTLDGEPIPLWHAFLWRAGAILECGRCVQGARTYLACAGGIPIQPQLGSRSTLINGPFEGLLQRPLKTGDTLPIFAGNIALTGRAWQNPPSYVQNVCIRFIPGPHYSFFAAINNPAQFQWQVSVSSNRMGLRLSGSSLNSFPGSIHSRGIIPGTIQVPADGQPIIGLADAQVTGGYPILGVVIYADLTLLAQLNPGAVLGLQQTTQQEAYQALQTQKVFIDQPFAAEWNMYGAI